MAEKTDIQAEAAAEKAFAAAAEARTEKALPPAANAVVAAPAQAAEPEVEFPSKAKRTRQPKAEAPAAAAPVAAKPVEAPAVVVKPKAPARSALKASVVRRTPAQKPFKKPVPAIQPKVQPKAAPKAKIASQPKAAAPTIAAPKTMFQQLKEKTMDTTEFTTKIKSAVGEAQVKAKEAFDKGAATFGEYNEFSKGNLEAVVASGKILASGMQSLGTTFVEDGKNALEILTAEVKELASVKSPTDFFKLQAAFLRRNFDTVVATTSKNSEAVLKLASEAAAPISARVNLAVEKVKQTAA
jgi:phasin family protein